MNIRPLAQRLRLMPVVIVAAFGLLALKTSGLVHEAMAAEDATPPAPNKPAVDLAGPDDLNASPAEADILSTLGRRRSELDGRARDLDMRANLLAATEKRVDDKIAQLKELQALMTKLLNQRDAEQEKQIQTLVKTYSAMKAKNAAQIFTALDDDVLVPVAQEMKSDALAPILAAMPPSAAQKLTVKLASRLTLPETPAPPPPAMMPEPSPAPQPIAPQSFAPEAAPVEAAQKQAALTPPAAEKPMQVAAKQPAAVAESKSLPAAEVASDAKAGDITKPVSPSVPAAPTVAAAH